MARYSIPVLAIIWNNRNYQTVRHGFSGFDGRMEHSGHYAGMYLGDPNIDYVMLAKSQGVDGAKAETAGDFEKAIKRGIEATRRGEPFVIDVDISRIGGGADSTWYQAFNLAKKRTRNV
jgi:thiamine pyrophosphate-dependent acetolactate synthase large subunit-like protein